MSKQLYIEGKEGKRNTGELSYKTFREKKYFSVNLFDLIKDNIDLRKFNLAKFTPSSSNHREIFFHNGKGTIKADGSNTNEEGYYAWDEVDNEFKSLVQW